MEPARTDELFVKPAGEAIVPTAEWWNPARWPGDRDAKKMAAAIAGLCAVLYLLPSFLQFMPEPIGPAAEQFGRGARTTVQLTLVSGSLGLLIGVLIALARLSRLRLFRLPATGLLWVIRGTPLLVQLLFVYFALPNIVPGLRLSDFWSSIAALSINVGAYNSEIIRAGIQAVPPGQREAANALGLRPLYVMVLIVLPQAFRICLPPLVNNIVSLLKDSSLAYVIGVVELSLVGSRVQSESFRPIPVFVTVASIYLALTTFLTIFSHAMEQRMSRDRAQR
jgi:polar amino acid transport system permease protein